MKAQQTFKVKQLGSQAPLPTPPPEAKIVEVNLGCSQATLDLIVSYIYSQGIHVSTENAAELLTVGDYLMVRLQCGGYDLTAPPHYPGSPTPFAPPCRLQRKKEGSAEQLCILRV
jgi:hypothetical protein